MLWYCSVENICLLCVRPWVGSPALQTKQHIITSRKAETVFQEMDRKNKVKNSILRQEAYHNEDVNNLSSTRK